MSKAWVELELKGPSREADRLFASFHIKTSALSSFIFITTKTATNKADQNN